MYAQDDYATCSLLMEMRRQWLGLPPPLQTKAMPTQLQSLLKYNEVGFVCGCILIKCIAEQDELVHHTLVTGFHLTWSSLRAVIPYCLLMT
jgi:hypothetical protein